MFFSPLLSSSLLPSSLLPSSPLLSFISILIQTRNQHVGTAAVQHSPSATLASFSSDRSLSLRKSAISLSSSCSLWLRGEESEDDSQPPWAWAEAAGSGRVTPHLPPPPPSSLSIPSPDDKQQPPQRVFFPPPSLTPLNSHKAVRLHRVLVGCRRENKYDTSINIVSDRGAARAVKRGGSPAICDSLILLGGVISLSFYRRSLHKPPPRCTDQWPLLDARSPVACSGISSQKIRMEHQWEWRCSRFFF